MMPGTRKYSANSIRPLVSAKAAKRCCIELEQSATLTVAPSQ